MSTLYPLSFIFIVFGAISWGTIGLFNINPVSYLFGENSILSRIIYLLIGISGIWFMVNT